MNKRYPQFSNFENMFLLLQAWLQKKSLDHCQQVGIVRFFELTFDLSWKTLGDFLEYEGISADCPRNIIKSAFASGLIQDGHLWMKMLEERDCLLPSLDLADVARANNRIKTRYFSGLEQVYVKLKSKN